jgi:hypothetical protein
METLDKELDAFIEKLNNPIDFRNELENISSVYPFNKYEYIISALPSKNVLFFDRTKATEPLYIKALSSNSKSKFLMNFQQLKPSCCDVFLWLAVYRDCVRYWVLKNDVVRNHSDYTPQHRNENTPERAKDYDKSEIYEGQIMITNDNIGSIKEYMVEGRGIRQAIIEQFEAPMAPPAGLPRKG